MITVVNNVYIAQLSISWYANEDSSNTGTKVKETKNGKHKVTNCHSHYVLYLTSIQTTQDSKTPDELKGKTIITTQTQMRTNFF